MGRVNLICALNLGHIHSKTYEAILYITSAMYMFSISVLFNNNHFIVLNSGNVLSLDHKERKYKSILREYSSIIFLFMYECGNPVSVLKIASIKVNSEYVFEKTSLF